MWDHFLTEKFKTIELQNQTIKNMTSTSKMKKKSKPYKK